MTTMSSSLAGAAALFALSAAAFAAAPPAGSSGVAVAASDKVNCYGVNSCKGLAECKTSQNSCKGLASCKGLGFMGMAAAQCLTKGGIIGDLKTK